MFWNNIWMGNMKESKKETGLWIKNNTSDNKSNTKMDKEI